MHQVDPSPLTFDLSKEVELLKTEETWRSGVRNAKTLLKDAELRIVVILMRQGARMEEHRAPGRTSIQTLTGCLRLKIDDKEIDLPAGQVLMLDRDVAHDVEARDESAFLLTIAWPPSPSESTRQRASS